MANYYNPYQYPYGAYPGVTQNPLTASQPNVSAGQGGILWVQGENGAKAYPVAPNNNVLLMDSESKRFYIKSADASGMPSLRAFEYSEVIENKTDSGVEYATKKDLEALKAEILSVNNTERMQHDE